ncbi:MAG: Galactoside O-acetyltransferase [Syntrophorhabdus sp. PtaB.Bin027]|nr:MAG: Galactoside O-acetyltransferase [Syntrophorhabdus sp. PtaB.Bin027]
MRKIDRDSLPHLVNVACRIISRHYFTLLAKIAAWWWGVDLAGNCTFYGRVRFFRHPRSRIAIGSGCQFRSSPTSNPMGNNRPCILTTLDDGAEIVIGPNCGFSGTSIVCKEKITLGKNVRCGPNTTIMDTDGHDDDHRSGTNKPVLIEDGVWLGANVSVYRGVMIGENTFIAASSTVTRSFPGNTFIAGSPARPYKKME